MTIGEILVWIMDLGMLAWLIRQGEILLKNDKEKLDLERKSFTMATERYEERKTWREQKRKQQERKVVAASEEITGAIPSDGTNVAEDTRLSEGLVRGMQETDGKT